MALHALLLLDRLPILCLLVGAAAQVSHHTLLKRFPYNSALAPSSLASAGLTLAATGAWLHHFWTSRYSGEYMVAFCLVTTWLTPFALLLGVTGEQAVLPGAGGFPYSSPGPAQHGGAAPPKKASRRGLALRMFDVLRRKRDDVVPGLVSHLPGVTKEKI